MSQSWSPSWSGMLMAALGSLPLLVGAAGHDVSKVNSSIHIDAQEQVGNVHSVNGSIHLEDGVRAEDVETVNGSIHIGEHAYAQALQTVNGTIRVGAGSQAQSVETVNGALVFAEGTRVAGDVTAVNGAIHLASNAEVSGQLKNVNGSMELDHARIGGGIETTNGSIDLGAGTTVNGGILVEKHGFSLFTWNSKPPRITIGPDCVVNGTLKFEREVELYVSDSAKIGRVVGATPIEFSGDRPGRADEKTAELAVER